MKDRIVRYFSVAFGQPLGERVGDGGYHLDMRVKAATPEWPPAALLPLADKVWVVRCQWGLGAYEQFLVTGDERWLTGACAAGDEIIAGMTEGGPLDGGLAHAFAYPHTYDLAPGWLSAMAQGEAASLLVRLHRATGQERYADAARRALVSLRVPVSEGGVGREWQGGWWLEEYPTEPASFVLNGAIFAMLGLHDAGTELGDTAAAELFAGTAAVLTANVRRWDLGWWSTYDLFPFPRMRHIASRAYQELHPALLRALHRAAPDPALIAQAERFEAQLADPAKVVRATAGKVAFRLAVPR